MLRKANKKVKKYRVTGHYVNPYTYEVKRLDVTIGIGSKAAAIKNAKSSYFRAHVTKCVQVATPSGSTTYKKIK